MAEALGVRPDTVRTWRTRGGGPPYRHVGRAVLYNAADVWAWQREREDARSTAVQEFGEWLEATSSYGSEQTKAFVEELAEAHRRHTEWRQRMDPRG